MKPSSVSEAAKLLQVKVEGLTQSQLREAFKQAALKSHPDKTKGTQKPEFEFKDVKRAHDLLNDYIKNPTAYVSNSSATPSPSTSFFSSAGHHYHQPAGATTTQPKSSQPSFFTRPRSNSFTSIGSSFRSSFWSTTQDNTFSGQFPGVSETKGRGHGINGGGGGGGGTSNMFMEEGGTTDKESFNDFFQSMEGKPGEDWRQSRRPQKPNTTSDYVHRNIPTTATTTTATNVPHISAGAGAKTSGSKSYHYAPPPPPSPPPPLITTNPHAAQSTVPLRPVSSKSKKPSHESGESSPPSFSGHRDHTLGMPPSSSSSGSLPSCTSLRPSVSSKQSPYGDGSSTRDCGIGEINRYPRWSVGRQHSSHGAWPGAGFMGKPGHVPPESEAGIPTLTPSSSSLSSSTAISSSAPLFSYPHPPPPSQTFSPIPPPPPPMTTDRNIYDLFENLFVYMGALTGHNLRQSDGSDRHRRSLYGFLPPTQLSSEEQKFRLRQPSPPSEKYDPQTGHPMPISSSAEPPTAPPSTRSFCTSPPRSPPLPPLFEPPRHDDTLLPREAPDQRKAYTTTGSASQDTPPISFHQQPSYSNRPSQSPAPDHLDHSVINVDYHSRLTFLLSGGQMRLNVTRRSVCHYGPHFSDYAQGIIPLNPIPGCQECRGKGTISHDANRYSSPCPQCLSAVYQVCPQCGQESRYFEEDVEIIQVVHPEHIDFSHRIIRIPGQGHANELNSSRKHTTSGEQGERGDLLVHLRPDMPNHISLTPYGHFFITMCIDPAFTHPGSIHAVTLPLPRGWFKEGTADSNNDKHTKLWITCGPAVWIRHHDLGCIQIQPKAPKGSAPLPPVPFYVLFRVLPTSKTPSPSSCSSSSSSTASTPTTPIHNPSLHELPSSSRAAADMIILFAEPASPSITAQYQFQSLGQW